MRDIGVSLDMSYEDQGLTEIAQSRPFDLLVFPFWSSFSHGPKRLTFYFWVLWASESLKLPPPLPIAALRASGSMPGVGG